MINSKILKLIYNKNNFIKFLIVCTLAYIIYLLYNKFYKINEDFLSNHTNSPDTYAAGFTDVLIVPPGVTSATTTQIPTSNSEQTTTTFRPTLTQYLQTSTTKTENKLMLDKTESIIQKIIKDAENIINFNSSIVIK